MLYVVNTKDGVCARRNDLSSIDLNRFALKLALTIIRNRLDQLSLVSFRFRISYIHKLYTSNAWKNPGSYFFKPFNILGASELIVRKCWHAHEQFIVYYRQIWSWVLCYSFLWLIIRSVTKIDAKTWTIEKLCAVWDKRWRVGSCDKWKIRRTERSKPTREVVHISVHESPGTPLNNRRLSQVRAKRDIHTNLVKYSN